MKTNVAWFLILNALLQCVFFASGCASGRARVRPAPAAATLSAPGVEFAQDGAAAVPATVKTTGRKITLPLPAGTEVVPDLRNGGFSYRLAFDSVAVFEVSDSQATGPASFTPPAPPTASEMAIALSIERAFAVGAVLAIIGLLLAWRGHGKGAGIAFLGAVGVPAAARFLGSTAGLIVAAVSITGALGLFAAWHLIEWRKKKAAEQAAAVGRNLQSSSELRV